jgi:type IV secretion system protein VirD4
MPPIKTLLVLVLLLMLFLLFVRWAWWPQRHLPGNRVRYMNLRSHLRLHPGRGFATVFELWWHWGKWSVLRKSRRMRPDLSWWKRLRHPAWHSVFIGRGHYRHALRIVTELHTLVMSPPRKGKTLWLAKLILRYPGPAVVTSVKEDVFRYTSGIRARRGPIEVFNPEGIGGVPSTFAIDPVYGCQNKLVAARRAIALVESVDTSKMKDGDWFRQKATSILAGLMHAGALVGADMRMVAAWAFTTTEEAEKELARRGDREMASVVHELHNSPAEKTAATFQMVLSQILGFLMFPELAQCVLPERGLGFDIRQFIRSDGTLYMIADADNEVSPLAPLFAMILSEIKHEATAMGQQYGRGRLARPFGWFLDEVVNICPVPLDKWLSHVGGLGVQIFSVVHGEAQLRQRWGEHGAQTIWDTSDVKLLLPGITDDKTLDKASKVLDKVSLRQRGQDPSSLRQRGQEYYTEHDVMTPGMIRALHDRLGLCIRGNRAPVLVHLPRVIRSPDYLWARLRGHDIAHIAGIRALPQAQPQVLKVPELEDGQPQPVPAGNGHKLTYPWDEGDAL